MPSKKKAIFWSFINKFFPQLINFIVTIILSRVIEPYDFGNLYESYENLVWILNEEDQSLCEDYKHYASIIKQIFDITLLQESRDFDTNFFNEGINSTIDNIDNSFELK